MSTNIWQQDTCTLGLKLSSKHITYIFPLIFLFVCRVDCIARKDERKKYFIYKSALVLIHKEATWVTVKQNWVKKQVLWRLVILSGHDWQKRKLYRGLKCRTFVLIFKTKSDEINNWRLTAWIWNYISVYFFLRWTVLMEWVKVAWDVCCL